ncbi:M15 family metallopeptidase [Oceanibacterium hippocampi]|uniref:D-alanyl-D-alanine dipeptidase n=1 Tax=Oceanibacterium hippocampi TaxID=745714 RepID=A0A1Y5THW4_9PROT|nr:M15 family metallopeptidase [Oceanibacterium hippocampi]SLN64665.1 D-alanyl-D-alanine dipeptidase [Oceanibacterium hippocampi]
MSETNAREKDYWTSAMEDAAVFMSRASDVTISDHLEPFGGLRESADEAGVEVLFSDKPIATDMERQFYLRRGLIPAFIGAAREMNDRGWVLKVEDAYRTPLIQKKLQATPELFDAALEIVLWETDGVMPDSAFIFRRLLALIAYCPMAGTHISGTAMDISVVHRDSGEEVDRGAPYLEFSVKTPMRSPFVSDAAKANRQEITALMKRHGFVDYPWEFWHYNQGDSYEVVLSGDPSRGRYGPVEWDPVTGTATAVPNPRERLNSDAEIRSYLDAAIARRTASDAANR